MFLFGICKWIEIVCVLVMELKLMLFDEPVVGMSVEEREQIIAFVRCLYVECGLMLLFVEHDMNMVMRIVERVLVLDFG